MMIFGKIVAPTTGFAMIADLIDDLFWFILINTQQQQQKQQNVYILFLVDCANV